MYVYNLSNDRYSVLTYFGGLGKSLVGAGSI